MNRNRLYKEILLLVFFGFVANLTAVVNRPRGDEVNIKLKINGKERIYYELDEDGLHYKNIGIQLNPDDSIQVGIFTRTIKNIKNTNFQI